MASIIEPQARMESVPPPLGEEFEGGGVVALPDGLAWWRAAMAEMQEREAEARTSARELRLELAAARVEQERANTTVSMRERALGESAVRERNLQADLLAARTALRDSELEVAEARGLIGSLEHDGKRVKHELAAQTKLATGRERQLSDLKAELSDLRAERRVLANRAERLARNLENVTSSRTYRVVRIVWRIRGALTRPFRRA